MAGMANHPHAIDRWDAATREPYESIAAVGDYLVALETYRAAVKRWPKDKITLRNRRGCSRRVGGINGRCSAHCAPLRAEFLKFGRLASAARAGRAREIAS